MERPPHSVAGDRASGQPVGTARTVHSESEQLANHVADALLGSEASKPQNTSAPETREALRELRVLILDTDQTRAETWAAAARAQDALVTVAEPSEDGLRSMRGTDADVVLLDSLAIDRGGFEVVRHMRRDPQLKWAALFVARWQEIWQDPSTPPDLDALIARIEPLIEPAQSLRQLLGNRDCVDTRLELLGPARLLRLVARVGGTWHLTIRSMHGQFDVDVSDDLVVGVVGKEIGSERVTRVGPTAMEALLGLDKARVRIERRGHPKNANMMAPIDEALTGAMQEVAERTVKLAAVPEEAALRQTTPDRAAPREPTAREPVAGEEPITGSRPVVAPPVSPAARASMRPTAPPRYRAVSASTESAPTTSDIPFLDVEMAPLDGSIPAPASPPNAGEAPADSSNAPEAKASEAMGSADTMPAPALLSTPPADAERLESGHRLWAQQAAAPQSEWPVDPPTVTKTRSRAALGVAAAVIAVSAFAAIAILGYRWYSASSGERHAASEYGTEIERSTEAARGTKVERETKVERGTKIEHSANLRPDVAPSKPAPPSHAQPAAQEKLEASAKPDESAEATGQHTEEQTEASPPNPSPAIDEVNADDAANSDALVRSARRSISRGDLVQAEQALNQATTLDPKNPRAMAGWAKYYLVRKQPAKALEWIEQAVKRRSRRVAYHLLHGDILKAAGRPADARRAWQRVLEREPDHREAKARLGL